MPSLKISATEKFALSRSEAAAFVGATLSKFDEMVTSEEMPPPRRLGGAYRWVRTELERAVLDAPSKVPTVVRSIYEQVGR